MAQASRDHNLRDGYSGPDRRRGGLLGKAQRVLIAIVRSRWVAMIVVSFAVSWSFHVVDSKSDNKVRHQQAVLTCTIQGVADAQQAKLRTLVRPILEACEKQEDK